MTDRLTTPPMRACSECNALCPHPYDPLTAELAWHCSDACQAAWAKRHGYVITKVENLDADGRAELDSILSGRRGLRSVK